MDFWPSYTLIIIIQVSNLLAMTDEINQCCGWDYKFTWIHFKGKNPILISIVGSELAFYIVKLFLYTMYIYMYSPTSV